MTLDEIKKLTGLPFKRYLGQFVASCYLDGSPHKTFNKIFTTFYDGSWWLTEQGGEVMSLQQWMKIYGDGTKVMPDTKIEEPPKIERKFVAESIYKKTFPVIYTGNLFKHLSRMFGVVATHESFVKYGVGEYSKRDTVFWYRNEFDQWLHDVIIPYRTDGRRDKTVKFNGNEMSSWRKCTAKKGYTGRGVFGGNLIKGHTGDICVVESEKTALIMSLIEKRGRLWVACGGSNKTAQIRDGWLLFPDFDNAGKFWECFGCENKGKDGCIIERVDGKRTKSWGCEFGSVHVRHWFEGLEMENGDDPGDYVIKKYRRRRL